MLLLDLHLDVVCDAVDGHLQPHATLTSSVHHVAPLHGRASLPGPLRARTESNLLQFGAMTQERSHRSRNGEYHLVRDRRRRQLLTHRRQLGFQRFDPLAQSGDQRQQLLRGRRASSGAADCGCSSEGPSTTRSYRPQPVLLRRPDVALGDEHLQRPGDVLAGRGRVDDVVHQPAGSGDVRGREGVAVLGDQFPRAAPPDPRPRRSRAGRRSRPRLPHPSRRSRRSATRTPGRRRGPEHIAT